MKLSVSNTVPAPTRGQGLIDKNGNWWHAVTVYRSSGSPRTEWFGCPNSSGSDNVEMTVGNPTAPVLLIQGN